MWPNLLEFLGRQVFLTTANSAQQYTVAATVCCQHKPIYSSVAASRWRREVTDNALQAYKI